LVSPRLMVEPVLEAEPPSPLEVPSTRAFSAGVAAGVGTTTSFPEAVAPAATITVVGGFTAPEPGGGVGGAGGVGMLLAPPPHPTAILRITRTIKRWNKAHHPAFQRPLKRCLQQNRCCTSGKPRSRK
jgi:hypothetical protein